jgi:hypothetical protein
MMLTSSSAYAKNINVNRYSNSSGGNSTLKKKYASKFSKVSSNSQFSINGINNHHYTGNQNTILSHDPFSSASNSLACKTPNMITQYTTKHVSTKNTKGLLSKKLLCSPLNSQQCYNKVNHVLVEKNLNKHFREGNKDQDLHIENLKATCSINRERYLEELESQSNNQSNSQTNNQNKNCYKKKERCNITKDNNHIKGYTPGYSLYYGDSTLFKKKQACNLHNPPDAVVIAC